MDEHNFDALTKSLTGIGSRRVAFTGLVGGAVGVLSGHAIEKVAAHDTWTKSRCKNIKDKKKAQKCKKEEKDHKKWHETNACREAGQYCNDRTCCVGSVCAGFSPSAICLGSPECTWEFIQQIKVKGVDLGLLDLAYDLAIAADLWLQGRHKEAWDLATKAAALHAIPVPWNCFPVRQVE